MASMSQEELERLSVDELASLLNDRQKLFVEYYIQLGGEGCGTEAAIKAGYSPRTAAQQASRLLRKAEIKAYVRVRMRARVREEIASTDELMNFFSRVMRGDELDRDGNRPALADRIKAAGELSRRYSSVEKLERSRNSDTSGVIFRFEEEVQDG